MKRIFLFLSLSLLVSISSVFAQNITITDNDTHNADESAVLDVYSTSKGMLIPRMTTAQREAITTTAVGLLVFDTDFGGFFFYNGSWTNLTDENDKAWTRNGSTNSVYLSQTTDKVGIGTSSPDALFEVKNNAGDLVFAVYPEGVRMYVNEGEEGGENSGFVVSGQGTSASNEMLRITRDSARIYIEEQAKGSRGGFAVGNTGAIKGEDNNVFEVYTEGVRMYVNEGEEGGENSGFVVSGQGALSSNEMLRITRDSARIYIEEQAKGSRGGFAVGNTGAIKGEDNNVFEVYTEGVRVYVDEGEEGGENSGFVVSGQGTSASKEMLRITRDSARIYIEEQAKGARGGFAVGNTGAIKGTGDNMMFIDEDNFFIGIQSGASITTGVRNTFMGYQSGYSNTTGNDNFFAGKEAGLNNTGGFQNIFLGNQAGKATTTGNRNIFLGVDAGLNNTGSLNIFIGNKAGYSETSGQGNISIGESSGHNLTTGVNNVFMGNSAGYQIEGGWNNVFIGNNSGFNVKNTNNNTYVGCFSGTYNVDGVENTFIGNWAGCYGTTGSYNVYLGRMAGRDASGDYNVYIGHNAGSSRMGAGEDNVGENNVFLGRSSGYSNTTGSENVYLGMNANYNNEDGERNIIIGYSANYTATTGSDLLYIGNTDASTKERYFIRGEFGNNHLELNTKFSDKEGKVTINDVMQLKPRDDAPTAPDEGDIYYDTDHTLKYYNGTVWKTLITD